MRNRRYPPIRIQKNIQQGVNRAGPTEFCLLSVPIGEQEERINIEAVAQGLREIAAQFELEMVERAAQNLSRNIQETPNNVSSALHHTGMS